MSERDGYEHGVPCWVDTWQEDADTAATFYAGVFGWDVEKATPPGTDTRYCMCRLRESDVAAIGSPRPAGMPAASTAGGWRSSPIPPARCSACGRPAPIGARSASTSRAPTR